MTTPDPAALREALETAMGGYDVALSDFTGPHMPRIWAAARWALDLIEEGALIIAKEDGQWPAALVERLDGLIDRAGGFSGEAQGILDALERAEP